MGVRDVDENNLSHHFLEGVAMYPQLVGQSRGWSRVPALPQPHRAPRGCHVTYVGSPLQNDVHSLPSSPLL